MVVARDRFRLIGALGLAAATIYISFAPPVLAWGQYYYRNDGTTCVTAGQAAVSAWNSNLNVNHVSGWFVCESGFQPQMGTTYARVDGSTYPYKWSNDSFHGIVDTRTISYGRSICRANWGNGTGVNNFYCYTGN